jgi:hypothetical protein
MMVKSNLKIEVNDEIVNNYRTITITVTVKARVREFILTDQLTTQGVIKPFEASLQQAVRETVDSYLFPATPPSGRSSLARKTGERAGS